MIESVILGVVWYLIFLISPTWHEAAHAYAARLGGDDTAYLGGQVSLDPMPHIRREPMGMVLFPIISLVYYNFPMGWASAPYDPIWARHNHRKAALMAFAGPLANFALVLISGIILKILLFQGIVSPHQIVSSVADHSFEINVPVWLKILGITFFLNLLLFAFNLLPLPGFDGGSVITYFMNKQQANKISEIMTNPGYNILSFIIAWNIFPYVFWPIFGFVFKFIFI